MIIFYETWFIASLNGRDYLWVHWYDLYVLWVRRFFLKHLYCLVGCLSMIIVWTNAVVGVLYACVFCFCFSACTVAIENVSHRKAL